MNTTPAASSVTRSRRLVVSSAARKRFSKSAIVCMSMAADCESCASDHSMSARPARHCAAVSAVGLVTGLFMPASLLRAESLSQGRKAACVRSTASLGKGYRRRREEIMRAGFVAGLLSVLSTALCAQALYVVPDGVETRWASPENPGGERGKGASANAGRKGSASWALKAGEQRTLAQVKGGSGMVRRIWMTI